jgi:phosphoglycolate phosphatase
MIVGLAVGAAALVLWDIDHTLIENDGVSKATYALAAELLTGHPTTTPPVTEGRTDAAIMAGLLSGNGCDPERFPLRQIWEALTEAGRRNEAQLRTRGHALPGAAECLRRLAADSHVIQSTLTGNVEANAHVKLRAFGLDPWIDFSVGGYGVLHERPLLVPVAQYRAAARYGFDPRAEATVLIGDTPADVEAALTGGARVLAVATGTYSVAELGAAGADAVITDLTDVDGFERHLRKVIDAGPVGVRSASASHPPTGITETPGTPETPSALATWARSIAAHFLDVPGLRERRWPHVQAVAAKAERIAGALGPDGSLLIPAAWLHDIGYSPALAHAGFHPLDAADFLRTAGMEGPLASLVARHSGAVHEAAERGLARELAPYPDEVDAARDALWACDLTTDPQGETVTLAQRLDEIAARYGPDHLVTRAITAAGPEFEAAVERTRRRLNAAGHGIDL